MWNYPSKHVLQKDIIKHYNLEIKIIWIERSKFFFQCLMPVVFFCVCGGVCQVFLLLV